MKNEDMVLPVLALRGLVVFPGMMLHFDVSRRQSINAVRAAMSENQYIFLTAQKDAGADFVQIGDVFEVGVIAKILQVVKQSDGMARVVIEGKKRAKIVEDISGNDFLCAAVSKVSTVKIKDELKNEALMRTIKSVYEKYVELTPQIPADILFKVGTTLDSEKAADLIASNILLDYRLKQEVLSAASMQKRMSVLLDLLQNEVLILEQENEINDMAHSRIDEHQREYFLREKLQVIREELGEQDSADSEVEEYLDKIFELGADEKVIKELPWNKFTKERIDVKKVRTALDKGHFGLAKVKEKILEQLAVRRNAPDAKGQIICLAGPPGVGKTSIAMSVAKAINRKCARIALGGVRDEAEIRGHRKTYLGSMPGRIMAAVKTAGAKNCVLILDEIDKLGSDYKGDPTSALLEVLDSEQNIAFYDHYIDLPFDLSKVMFITTANDVSAIPAPLRDRMEIIELESYTREEKFHIAKKHLIPKQLKNCNLTSQRIKFTNDALYEMIDFYTREAGVRTLERTIASVLAKVLLKIQETEMSEPVKITGSMLSDILGPHKYNEALTNKKDEVGLVNGLAWTAVGGELLPIEAAVMEGTGKLELTGSLGDVMQESAKAAVTYIRSNVNTLGVDSQFYKNRDIHIHAPEGAVPKDGPSAGVTMATAVYSALSQKKVRCDVAMTGEVTIRGTVLPIGGLKEKSMAAYRAGIKTVIIPKENVRDLAEIDPAVKEKVEFIAAENISEVLSHAIVDFRKNTEHTERYVLFPNKTAGAFNDVPMN